jgi:hypothetical protein
MMPELPLKPVTPAASSFDATKSAGPTETSPELLLLQISRRRYQIRKRPAMWPTLLVMVALLFAQALASRDTHQTDLHQRDITPELR